MPDPDPDPTTWPLPGPASEREVHLRRVSSASDPDWVAFLGLAAASEPDHPDFQALADAFDPLVPGKRTVLLAKRVCLRAPEAAALVRTRTDLDRRTLDATVAVMHPGERPEGPDLSGLLAEEIARIVRSGLTAWKDRIVPGSGVAVRVGPGPDGKRTGVPALAVADALDIPPSEEADPPPGVRPVVDMRDAGGRPTRLPEPVRIAPPPGRERAWADFLREVDAALASHAARLVLRMPDGVVEAVDETDMTALPATSWLCASPESRETLAEILASADWGRDAALSVSWDHRAVLSARAMDDPGWGRDFEAALVDVEPPSRADRRRDARRFWASFPFELASVMAARLDAPAPEPHRGARMPQ